LILLKWYGIIYLTKLKLVVIVLIDLVNVLTNTIF